MSDATRSVLHEVMVSLVFAAALDIVPTYCYQIGTTNSLNSKSRYHHHPQRSNIHPRSRQPCWFQVRCRPTHHTQHRPTPNPHLAIRPPIPRPRPSRRSPRPQTRTTSSQPIPRRRPRISCTGHPANPRTLRIHRLRPFTYPPSHKRRGTGRACQIVC